MSAEQSGRLTAPFERSYILNESSKLAGGCGELAGYMKADKSSRSEGVTPPVTNHRLECGTTMDESTPGTWMRPYRKPAAESIPAMAIVAVRERPLKNDAKPSTEG